MFHQASKTFMTLGSDSMADIAGILKDTSKEILGYIASAVVGMDGITIGSHANYKNINPEALSAQWTTLLKLVTDSVESLLQLGTLEDNLTSTKNAYIVMRYLPSRSFFLLVVSDRATGNPGNLRLMSRIVAERLEKEIPV
jgi:predicted regulator of Ras-like GTPase activity (Roadblock/LC7/MglB family)